MEPFIVHTGVVAPLPRPDVDTDQIIPKVFLKRVERTGFGPCLFHDWRFDAAGAERPDFVLNRAPYRDASILVVGPNFGCGSSREHAAWALLDHGFRVIVAPGFADIFRQNADRNGLLALTLSEDRVAALADRAARGDAYRLTVDLRELRVHDARGFEARFEMDAFRRECLLEGLDPIGLTLRVEDRIAAYEERRAGVAGAFGGVAGAH